ncbi:hypothetical protein STEG23_031987 [Scotinomys teguina]
MRANMQAQHHQMVAEVAAPYIMQTSRGHHAEHVAAAPYTHLQVNFTGKKGEREWKNEKKQVVYLGENTREEASILIKENRRETCKIVHKCTVEASLHVLNLDIGKQDKRKKDVPELSDSVVLWQLEP